ncbi:diguanylate cyclase [Planctomicrobium sp. SH661]|uniref:bifunctional diguanylate cyclase/phosphohydrolase n=1 Tax=Planctomicrobium sp. SH661 TaxID=3448124 RepID=UPI003F5C894C
MSIPIESVMHTLLKTIRILGGMAAAVAAALLLSRIVSGNWNAAVGQALFPTIVAAGLGLAAWRFLGIPVESHSAVVPGNFHSALDGLSEGIVILDYAGRIVFVNHSFEELSGHRSEELLEQRAKDLSWKWVDTDERENVTQEMSWLDAVKEGRSRCGRILGLNSETHRSFVMNSGPILDNEGHPRAAMISLQDVTKLQKKQTELASLRETVRESSMQLRQKNAELEQLILRDPQTGCYHRRHGLEVLEKLWNDARRDGSDLACILLDIDRFQAVNEEHGHQVADQILRDLGLCLLRNVREIDLVCRYGGEEFLIIMPHTGVDEGARLAETLRHQISRLKEGAVTLTVSIGVAAMSQAPGSPQSLLALVDQCLNRAKHRGRNQVCQPVPEDPDTTIVPTPSELKDCTTSIPYPAVTALISALAYRDIATASHSRRVADLCVSMGQRLMSMTGCYVLEVSALLHDIGKIGVPDATLLKSTPLTDEEWKVMQAHDRIGVEIVRTAFTTPELTEIVANYTRPYGESLSTGHPLPLGARILAVADAYDAMTTERTYRNAMSPAEALAELRRCAGTQFDPEIVSQFSEVLFLQGSESAPRMDVDIEAALAIGLELERLAEAVDEQDIETLEAIAGHLCRTANKCGAPEISAKAMELEQAAMTGTDQLGILQSANELLNYCRATQSAYFNKNMEFLRPASQERRSSENVPQPF